MRNPDTLAFLALRQFPLAYIVCIYGVQNIDLQQAMQWKGRNRAIDGAIAISAVLGWNKTWEAAHPLSLNIEDIEPGT